MLPTKEFQIPYFFLLLLVALTSCGRFDTGTPQQLLKPSATTTEEVEEGMFLLNPERIPNLHKELLLMIMALRRPDHPTTRRPMFRKRQTL